MLRRMERKKEINMRRFLKILLSLALLAALFCPCALAANYSAKVLSSSMDVYSSNKEKLGALKQGTAVTVTAISGDWARISYRGNSYYARMKDIIFNNRIAAISTQKTSIRFVTKASYAANTCYKATLAAGTPIYVVGLNGKQALVTNASGSILGYVKRSALKKQ